jgi:hypothetical protein
MCSPPSPGPQTCRCFSVAVDRPIDDAPRGHPWYGWNEYTPPGIYPVCTLGADVIPEMDQNTFADRLAQGDALVVDVRGARE